MDKVAATRLETNSSEERRKPRKLVNFPLCCALGVHTFSSMVLTNSPDPVLLDIIHSIQRLGY